MNTSAIPANGAIPVPVNFNRILMLYGREGNNRSYVFS